MEIDLSNGTELVYFLPEQMMTITDFYKQMEIVIKTKGYESWVSGEANLLITRGVVARLTNTSVASFKFRYENLLEFLSTNGVKAIAGKEYSSEPFNGELWRINPPEGIEAAKAPQNVQTWENKDKFVNLIFTHYENRKLPEEEYEDEDESEIERALIITHRALIITHRVIKEEERHINRILPDSSLTGIKFVDLDPLNDILDLVPLVLGRLILTILLFPNQKFLGDF